MIPKVRTPRNPLNFTFHPFRSARNRILHTVHEGAPRPPANLRTLLRPWARALIVLLLLLPAAAGAEEAGLKKATFIPQWVPQAQFAGYYTALDKGIYRKHGIDLEILPGGPDHPSDAAIENGQADFGTLWLSTSIPMRAEGVPTVSYTHLTLPTN